MPRVKIEITIEAEVGLDFESARELISENIAACMLGDAMDITAGTDADAQDWTYDVVEVE